MIISAINLKGGAGKTTSIMALATAAARDGFDATVYDADPQSSASSWADVAEESGEPLPFEVLPANRTTIAKLARKLSGKPDKWAFIDCPPGGEVTDDARKASDLVVVPSKTGPADLTKTTQVCSVLEHDNNAYVVAFTQVATNTNSYAFATSLAEENEWSCFKQPIPRRESLQNQFGYPFEKNLYGYEALWSAIKAGLAGEE